MKDFFDFARWLLGKVVNDPNQFSQALLFLALIFALLVVLFVAAGHK
jgi:hypothetical protein